MERDEAPQSDGIGWMGYGWVPVGAMFAAYIAIHGILTPGGGFQAGAIAASVYALVYFGQDYAAAMRLLPRQVADAFESLGAGAYALVGIATAIASGFYLANVLQLGKTGDILSGGTIMVINDCVFIEVAFGLIVAVELFLKQTRKREKGE
jgi:multicomponent Na+:H+ antiporter subunit B